MTRKPETRKPVRSLEPVAELPPSINMRHLRAPMRLIISKTIEKADPDQWFKVSTYKTLDSASRARRKFINTNPSLAGQVELEHRRVEEDGEQVGVLYARYNLPGS